MSLVTNKQLFLHTSATHLSPLGLWGWNQAVQGHRMKKGSESVFLSRTTSFCEVIAAAVGVREPGNPGEDCWLPPGSRIHIGHRPNTRYSQKVEMRLIFSLVIWPVWNSSYSSSTNPHAILYQSLAIISVTIPFLNKWNMERQYLICGRDNYSAAQGCHCWHNPCGFLLSFLC
jgi:hypothetical protein